MKKINLLNKENLKRLAVCSLVVVTTAIANASAVKIGRLDKEKVFQSANVTKVYQGEFKRQNDVWMEFMQILHSTNTAEVDLLENLRANMLSTQATNKFSVEKLQKQILQGDSRRKELMQKKDTLTDDDKKELDKFKNLDSKREEYKRSMQKVYDEYMKTMSDKAQMLINECINTCLKKIADEKGYTDVYSSEVLLFSKNDVTEDVIKEMNAKEVEPLIKD